MTQVFAKAALAAIVSAATSLLLVLAIVPALGGVVEGNALVMSILCPLVIAFPASAYTFWQKKRLADAMAGCPRPLWPLRRTVRLGDPELRPG